MKEKRKLTMLHARGYDYDRNVPSVILSGLWLKGCGFAPGDRVTVEKMEDGAGKQYIIRVWLEGEDPDCYNETAGQDWSISLKFNNETTNPTNPQQCGNP